VLAELLVRAGHRDPALAAEFLRPDLSRLEDPFLVGNIVPAVARLKAAIPAARRSSSWGLRRRRGQQHGAPRPCPAPLRARPELRRPARSEDGYGLSRSAIDRALEGGKPGLFIALDCGTNSHEEVAYLIGQGIDVLVVDHHRSRDQALQQGLLVNPHVEAPGGAPAQAAWQHLCTVGSCSSSCTLS
jgi:single-stranded-DNA-specific exonuclease